MSDYRFKKVAVLGAGVMGAQIAAHLVNVKVPVVLFSPGLGGGIGGGGGLASLPACRCRPFWQT